MLGIISMAGNALRSFGSIHPAIKWGVVAIVGLLAVEYIAKEGIEIYARLATVQTEIAAQTVKNKSGFGPRPFVDNGPTVEADTRTAADAEACRNKLRAEHPDFSDRALNKMAQGEFACPGMPGYDKAAP